MKRVMDNRIDELNLNSVHQLAVELIQDDLRYLYSIIKNREKIDPTYWIALSPYIGLIIDGTEDWIKSYNNSSKEKIDIPLFNPEEEQYYVTLRNACKIWNYTLEDFQTILKARYNESDEYFGSLCKRTAKVLHLYDVMGIFTVDKFCCGNTILDACYIPGFNLQKPDGECIKRMSSVAGRFIREFGINEEYNFRSHIFDTNDYGGFIKIPFGNVFSFKHVLFACLCTINFVLHGIEEIIYDEVSTKLRMEYICYYYMENMLIQIRDEYNIDFSMFDQYISQEFRNSLAHYKLGVALKKDELVLSDPLKGLTQKYFQTDYDTVKKFLLSELSNTADKIEGYLGVRKR